MGVTDRTCYKNSEREKIRAIMKDSVKKPGLK